MRKTLPFEARATSKGTQTPGNAPTTNPTGR